MTPTPYVKQTWIDGDSTKPTSAARLGVMEQGIFDAHYRPNVSVSQAAQLTLTTGTTTVITFDTENFDSTGSMHSTVTNTGRLVAPVTGTYRISGRCAFVANAGGIRVVSIRVNGTTVIDTASDEATSSAMYLHVGRDWSLTAGDYVEMTAVQNSGGNLLTGAGIDQMHFEMHDVSY